MRNRRSQAGDTLVEVVMAIAILSVVLISAFNIANQSYRVGMQARERTEAVSIAQRMAERMIAQRDELVRTVDPATPILTVANFPCPVTTVGIYTVQCTRQAVDSVTYPGAPLLDVTINVQWQSLVGSIELNTLDLNVKLADLRNSEVCDDSVKGDPRCLKN